MLTDEQIAMMHRHITLVGAIAKHSLYSEDRVSDVVGEAEYPLIKQAVDQHDVDVASLFAELRIFHQMFAAKLEGFRNGRAGDVEQAQGAESSEPRAADGGQPEADREGAGGSGPSGERAERPNTERGAKRTKRRPPPVDAGDD